MLAGYILDTYLQRTLYTRYLTTGQLSRTVYNQTTYSCLLLDPMHLSKSSLSVSVYLACM